MPDTIQLNATTFEIIRRDETSQRTVESTGVKGYIGLDDTNAFEALRDLCSRSDVDKVIIVYQDHAFSLLGVSFSTVNSNPPGIRLSKNNYKFEAKDIQLEGLHRS